MTVWQRIEGQCRSEALAGGLEARIADPLWMLARQWQIGELRGDDAARPVGVTLRTRSLPLSSIGGVGATPSRPLPDATPLEFVVERVSEPTTGEAGQHSSARIGHRLLRMLVNAGLAAARQPLRDEFGGVTASQRLATTGQQAATGALLGRLAVDGNRLLSRSDAQLTTLLQSTLDAAQLNQALAVISEWRSWCAKSRTAAGNDAWVDDRLEYAFAVSAQDTTQPLTLTAGEHTGGAVDWFSFDVVAATDSTKPPKRSAAKKAEAGIFSTSSSLPSPVQYRGQPAARWWQFEDGRVNFADIDAGPADLARMLVTEFAVSYSDDWFAVPARVDVGTATEVRNMTVVDNFGTVTPLESVASHDGGSKGARPWRMFEVTGDELLAGHSSPWLVVPHTTVGDLTGDALERVAIVRDEGANLVWGIERLVEGPSGRPLDRALLAPPTVEGDEPANLPSAALSYESQVWSYRLESGVPPPYWIPFVAERSGKAITAEVRLRRARMQQWSTAGIAGAGPQGTILDGTRPCWIREEEVPRSGIRVDRRWRYARGVDGVGYLWLQLEKSPAGGERSSGVRWDVIEISGAT